MEDHHWKHTAKGVHEGTPLWADQQKKHGETVLQPPVGFSFVMDDNIGPVQEAVMN